MHGSTSTMNRKVARPARMVAVGDCGIEAKQMNLLRIVSASADGTKEGRRIDL